MRGRVFAAIGMAMVLAAGPAEGGGAKPLEAAHSFVSYFVIHSGHGPLRFAFTQEAGVLVDAESSEGGGAEWASEPKQPVVGVAAKESDVAWVAFELAQYGDCFSLKGCKKKVTSVVNATTLMQSGSPIATHIAHPITGADQSAAIKAGSKLPAVARKIDKGAEDLVKVFEASIGDPKLLIATVSPRPDVVLLGSAASERWMGGEKVKATLTKWKFGFKVNGGVQAGVSAGKTVGWVAANVDAFPMAKPASTTPFRVTAFYEKSGATWQVVTLHFSYATNPYADMP